MTMAADIEPVPSLQYLDARDYRLIVLVDHERVVEVAHQHADDDTARDDMALLAAQVIDELGPAVVDDHLQAIQLAEPQPIESHPRSVRIHPPRRGRFVLVCGRCGRAVNATSLRRAPRLFAGTTGPIDPIICKRCASA